MYRIRRTIERYARAKDRQVIVARDESGALSSAQSRSTARTHTYLEIRESYRLAATATTNRNWFAARGWRVISFPSVRGNRPT